MRYGFMTLGVMLALIVPFTLGNGFPAPMAISSAGTQPAPNQEVVAETTVAPDDSRPVAMATMTADYHNRMHETELITEEYNVVSKQEEPQLTPGFVLVPGE
jgi:hypothetical protein